MSGRLVPINLYIYVKVVVDRLKQEDSVSFDTPHHASCSLVRSDIKNIGTNNRSHKPVLASRLCELLFHLLSFLNEKKAKEGAKKM